MERRLRRRHHAVIVVAEGAGQNLTENVQQGEDELGDKTLGGMGVYLKDRISQHFKSRSMEVGVKYIDPSYMIRSAPVMPMIRSTAPGWPLMLFMLP